MEKKNNKKLFAIIGGSVLAFILTIALSVSITLAYFGGEASGTQTVAMDKEVTVTYALGAEIAGGVTQASAALSNALPGQKVVLNSKATVASGTSGAFVAMKVTITSQAAAGEGAEAIAQPTLTLLDPTHWVEYEGYYFYVSSGTGASGVLQKVNNAGDATLQATFVLDPTMDNDYAEATLSIVTDIIAVQGVAYDDNGDVISAPTVSQAIKMFDQFDDNLYTPAG